MVKICYVHFVVLITICVQLCAARRQRRFLIVPPTAPTRHQFIAGVGIPLDLENQAVTSGWVFKGQYFLPVKAEDLRPGLFWEQDQDRKMRKESRRKREILVDELTQQQYESYDAEAVEFERNNATFLDEDPMNNDIDDSFWKDDEIVTPDWLTSLWSGLSRTEASSSELQEHARWSVYKSLEGIAESHGLPGRPCVLRSICEAAQTQFSHENGILGELLHIVLSPSTTNEKRSDHLDHEYQFAEEVGQSGKSCKKIYKNCHQSLLSTFSKIHDPVTQSIFNYLG